MKNTIAFLSLILALCQATHADESSDIRALKTLCTSPKYFDEESPDSQRAIQIYKMMKEFERQACDERGDDYIAFLYEKYQRRIDN